ncbi:alanine racemase [Azospirillum doebereinerae]|uniref:Alanine racemase n=1 Tax=Azospirillum doebereinerae TaxID=92933 RepID=A0A433J0D4_9PROT|nr:alanine racemase [Azospirillum doebereinerae]MCG5244173.1 alanine racemase [Azospirillum doebereinerae]RUQ62509.1 alanine racemase [Azospirillum doebereinerae]
MTDLSRRAAAILTVDLGAVVANWTRLRDRVAPAECAAVVKADAYGLGVAHVVPALAAAGCATFVVAQFDEALAVRAALGPESPARVLSLGGLPQGTEAAFVANRILPVLNHLGEVAAWQRFARERGERLPAVVHIDTGMNRLGLGPDELDILANELDRLDGIDVQVWMTHLACADEFESPMSAQQLGRFQTALARLPAAEASFANSSGIFHGKAFHFDLARPGCALYGVNPTPHLANPMLGTVRLDARVLQLRSVDAPMTVGYAAAHRVERAARIATIAVGYADGYLRSLSGRGHVYVDGIAAPIVGRISMDLITVDVTGLPEGTVQPGGLVELIGPSRPVDVVAAEAGTIGYEVLTSLGPRYHRVYDRVSSGPDAR